MFIQSSIKKRNLKPKYILYINQWVEILKYITYAIWLNEVWLRNYQVKI